MSTILEALRRLEEERRKSRQGMDPFREVLEPSAAPPRPGPSRRRQAAWVGAVVLVVVAAVLLTYRVARREDRQVREGVTSAAPAEEAVRVPASEQRRLARVQSPPSRDLASGPAGSAVRPPDLRPHEPAVRETAGSPDMADTLAVRLPERSSAPDSTVVLSEKSEREADSEEVGEDKEEVPLEGPDLEELVPEAEQEMGQEAVGRGPQGSPEATEDRPEPRRATAEEERGIRISAVVWSPQPESRFAVVNLRTLREGDEISGRLVDEIQPDGVVFVEGGQRYKVLLGRR